MGTTDGKNQGQTPPSEEPPGGPSLLAANDAALARFAKSFEASARRWELIVYPSLFAFIILAAYGFFLIYSLTQDMHILAVRMDPRMGSNMETMADHIAVLSMNIEGMSDRIEEMTDDVKSMTREVSQMNGHMAVMEREMVTMADNTNALKPMLVNMAAMNQSMQGMTANTGFMTRDMNQMSWDMYQMQRPMNMMNQFMPW